MSIGHGHLCISLEILLIVTLNFNSGGAAGAETGAAGLKRKIGAEAGVRSVEDDTKTDDY